MLSINHNIHVITEKLLDEIAQKIQKIDIIMKYEKRCKEF